MSKPNPVPPLTTEELNALRRMDSCTLADAIETFQVRLRNEGFMDGPVKCVFPQLKPVVGYAATVLIRGAAPAFAGPPYHDRTDLWEYIQSVPTPRVVVLQDTSSHRGLGSFVGEVHMNIFRTLGCVGVVTNGAVRDLPAAEAAGFQLFAVNVTVSHAYVHIVEFGGPVEVGGLTVRSGELLHGDLHGVQSIPFEVAGRIPAVAAEIAAKQQAIIDLCRSPEFSLEKLREAVRKK
ncbi:MAG TPA: RraA family protein [Verrucomicrobiae bacterium]|jgi:regulator of RNase E activity RraA|nr:RraA family protein [Verrucomicrobiae bacterium]